MAAKRARGLNDDEDTFRTSWTLVARLKDANDLDGWRDFYEMYRSVIVGVGIRSGLRPSEADEVVQETMASVAKNIERFVADPARGSFRSWLLTMARWRITDQLRKRLPVNESSRHDNASRTGTSTLGAIPDELARTVEEACEIQWQQALLQQALVKLQLEVSSDHYQVFHMADLEQRPLRDVARMVGKNPAQVYVIKFRVAQRLKRIVGALTRRLE